MDKIELTEILDKHSKWLDGNGGKYADLRYADLSDADLRYADLRDADLCRADLRSADLRYADLRSANLRSADLRSADLSGCKGLIDPVKWMSDNLEKTPSGYIAYKSFGSNFASPNRWTVKRNHLISEVVNPLPTSDCACGINVSTLEWQKGRTNVWRVLIKWEWLPSVVIPYNTDGKFRCGKVKLLKEIN